MKRGTYYNEIEPKAAALLRELIKNGSIPEGEVDERSIVDVAPQDVRGFRQCHWFAGIGGWALALRLAGVPDDAEVWTGSAPCQPFSEAGAGVGFADPRHLWPDLYWHIAFGRPRWFLGEQVEKAIGFGWLDLVRADLEAEDYAFGAVGLPAACVGAPHRRQRLFFVAHRESGRRGEECSIARGIAERDRTQGRPAGLEPGRLSGLLGNAECEGLALGVGFPGIPGGSSGADQGQAAVGTGVHVGDLADANGGNAGAEREQRCGEQRQQSQDGGAVLLADDDGAGLSRFAGLRLRGTDLHDADGRRPVDGFWANADWIPCRDNKWRPVEPGIFPLAYGLRNRVAALRGSGNAIVPQVAAAFIEEFLLTVPSIRDIIAP